MPENFTVDDTLFRAQAKKLVKQLKLDEVKVVREQAGLMAQLLAKVTPPFKSFPKMSGRPTYTTAGAQKTGAGAVKADFDATVKNIGKNNSWTDKKMSAAVRKGDTTYLQARLRHMKGSNKHNLNVRKFSNTIRNKQRNARGRVNSGTKPIVMLSSADVNRGRKAAVDNVGIAKASFALAALRFGRPKAPNWISRHFRKVNTPVKSPTKSSAVATFTSSAAGLDVTMRRLKQVERFRMVAMVKRLEALVKHDAKKAGFQTK
jgi:hypothetical protein